MIEKTPFLKRLRPYITGLLIGAVAMNVADQAEINKLSSGNVYHREFDRQTFDEFFPAVPRLKRLDLVGASKEFAAKLDCNRPAKEQAVDVPTYVRFQGKDRLVTASYVPGEGYIEASDVDKRLQHFSFFVLLADGRQKLETADPSYKKPFYLNSVVLKLPDDAARNPNIVRPREVCFQEEFSFGQPLNS